MNLVSCSGFIGRVSSIGRIWIYVVDRSIATLLIFKSETDTTICTIFVEFHKVEKMCFFQLSRTERSGRFEVKRSDESVMGSRAQWGRSRAQ